MEGRHIEPESAVDALAESRHIGTQARKFGQRTAGPGAKRIGLDQHLGVDGALDLEAAQADQREGYPGGNALQLLDLGQATATERVPTKVLLFHTTKLLGGRKFEGKPGAVQAHRVSGQQDEVGQTEQGKFSGHGVEFWNAAGTPFRPL